MAYADDIEQRQPHARTGVADDTIQSRRNGPMANGDKNNNHGGGSPSSSSHDASIASAFTTDSQREDKRKSFMISNNDDSNRSIESVLSLGSSSCSSFGSSRSSIVFEEIPSSALPTQPEGTESSKESPSEGEVNLQRAPLSQQQQQEEEEEVSRRIRKPGLDNQDGQTRYHDDIDIRESHQERNEGAASETGAWGNSASSGLSMSRRSRFKRKSNVTTRRPSALELPKHRPVLGISPRSRRASLERRLLIWTSLRLFDNGNKTGTTKTHDGVDNGGNDGALNEDGTNSSGTNLTYRNGKLQIENPDRYRRRGSVTKYKLDASIDEMQPSRIRACCSQEEPTKEFSEPQDRRRTKRLSSPLSPSTSRAVVAADGNGSIPAGAGGDYYVAAHQIQHDVMTPLSPDQEEDRTLSPRYLRRGGVTKYGLDAGRKQRLQPTDVVEDGKNLPRNPLPPPPTNDEVPEPQQEGQPEQVTAELPVCAPPLSSQSADEHDANEHPSPPKTASSKKSKKSKKKKRSRRRSSVGKSLSSMESFSLSDSFSMNGSSRTIGSESTATDADTITDLPGEDRLFGNGEVTLQRKETDNKSKKQSRKKKSTKKQKYSRRCSVTKYSLECSPTSVVDAEYEKHEGASSGSNPGTRRIGQPPLAAPTVKYYSHVDDDDDDNKEDEKESDASLSRSVPNRRISRRCSVLKDSMEQCSPVSTTSSAATSVATDASSQMTIDQLPLPLISSSRDGGDKAEDDDDDDDEEEEQSVAGSISKAVAPPERYPRRCSVLKDSMEQCSPVSTTSSAATSVTGVSQVTCDLLPVPLTSAPSSSSARCYVVDAASEDDGEESATSLSKTVPAGHRYPRRCSVLKDAMEQCSPLSASSSVATDISASVPQPPLLLEKNGINGDDDVDLKDEVVAPAPSKPPMSEKKTKKKLKKKHNSSRDLETKPPTGRKYSRRGSVTKYSLECSPGPVGSTTDKNDGAVADVQPPVPTATAESTTKSDLSNRSERNIEVDGGKQAEKGTKKSKGRKYSRRGSVTKYSLEDSHGSSLSGSSAVSTVGNSIEVAASNFDNANDAAAATAAVVDRSKKKKKKKYSLRDSMAKYSFIKTTPSINADEKAEENSVLPMFQPLKFADIQVDAAPSFSDRSPARRKKLETDDDDIAIATASRGTISDSASTTTADTDETKDLGSLTKSTSTVSNASDDTARTSNVTTSKRKFGPMSPRLLAKKEVKSKLLPLPPSDQSPKVSSRKGKLSRHVATGVPIVEVPSLPGKSVNPTTDTTTTTTPTNNQRNTPRGRKSSLVGPERKVSAASSCTSGSAKSVKFDSVEIKEYPLILGDNPAVTEGAPVTLDWHAQHESKVNIDIYEKHFRQRQVRKKKAAKAAAAAAKAAAAAAASNGEATAGAVAASSSFANLPRRRGAIPVQERAMLLLRAGYSLNEIADATVEANKIKKQRLQSLERQGWERLDCFLETTSKAIRRSVLDAKPSFVGAKTA